jgi:hypothetical protein
MKRSITSPPLHYGRLDRKTCEKLIDFLKICIGKARFGDREKIDAFKRLARL